MHVATTPLGSQRTSSLAVDDTSSELRSVTILARVEPYVRVCQSLRGGHTKGSLRGQAAQPYSTLHHPLPLRTPYYGLPSTNSDHCRVQVRSRLVHSDACHPAHHPHPDDNEEDGTRIDVAASDARQNQTRARARHSEIKYFR